MKCIRLLILLLFTIHISGFAQTIWHNPLSESQPVVRGKGWPQESRDNYNRLPDRAEKNVRPELWRLSTNSAGLSVAFTSNSPDIIVRYKVNSPYFMHHMPSTAVSGIDLYTFDCNGRQLWCAGEYYFADTITCTFKNINYKNTHNKGNEFQLYLPLLKKLEWLEIGVVQGSDIRFLPLRKEKPIVVYGTSIAQGIAASRPGMAWSNILERNLDRQVINMGFSGNALLENELIELINELDSKVIVLDNLPNLIRKPQDSVFHLVLNAVRQIRTKRKTPILLVEHAGYSNGEVNVARKAMYENLNRAQRKAYEKLKQEGVEQLFYLSNQEINLPIDATVDGTHPSDLGMQVYADAYENMIRRIINEPKGDTPTTRACRQRREPMMYEWNDRHNAIIDYNRTHQPEIVMIGNSIIHY